MNKKFGSLLSNLLLLIGIIAILGAFFDKDIPIAERLISFILGLCVCLIAKVPVIRHSLICIVAFLAGISGISLIINDSGSIDLAGLLTEVLCFGIAIFFGYKVFFRIRDNQISKSTNAKSNIPASEDDQQPIVTDEAIPPSTSEEVEIIGNPELTEKLIDYLSSSLTPKLPDSDIRDDFAKYGGINAELLTIDLMDGHDFEQWCANALNDMEYTNVRVTPGSGDQGVDVLAEMNGIKYAIQCKRYTADLGNTPIQEVHSGKYLYHCHVGVVITNRYFTNSAKELAEATGVLLWDRDWIKAYLESKANDDGSVIISHTRYAEDPPPLPTELEHDEMLPVAIDVILETGQASVSMIQRRLKLGYARAARILEDMEILGIVGPFEGSKPRRILITKDQWRTICKSIQK